MNLEAARARAVFERTRVHIGERYRCPIANVSLYFIETQPLIEVRYMKESYIPSVQLIQPIQTARSPRLVEYRTRAPLKTQRDDTGRREEEMGKKRKREDGRGRSAECEGKGERKGKRCNIGF